MILLASLALAACPATPASVVEHDVAALAAFGDLDKAGVASARSALLADLECLSAPLSPAEAARVHRVEAMARFVGGNREGAVTAWRSAVAAEPAWAFPDSLAPAGNPFRVAFETARTLGPGASVDVGVPSGVVLLVDGTSAGARPTERPAVVQVQDLAGAVKWSAYVDAGEAIPGLEHFAPAPIATVTEPKPQRKVRVSFVAAGGAAAASAGLYVAALTMKGTYLDPEYAATASREDSDALRTRANTLGWAGAGAAGLAGGLLGAGIAWQW